MEQEHDDTEQLSIEACKQTRNPHVLAPWQPTEKQAHCAVNRNATPKLTENATSNTAGNGRTRRTKGNIWTQSSHDSLREPNRVQVCTNQFSCAATFWFRVFGDGMVKNDCQKANISDSSDHIGLKGPLWDESTTTRLKIDKPLNVKNRNIWDKEAIILISLVMRDRVLSAFFMATTKQIAMLSLMEGIFLRVEGLSRKWGGTFSKKRNKKVGATSRERRLLVRLRILFT